MKSQHQIRQVHGLIRRLIDQAVSEIDAIHASDQDDPEADIVADEMMTLESIDEVLSWIIGETPVAPTPRFSHILGQSSDEPDTATPDASRN